MPVHVTDGGDGPALAKFGKTLRDLIEAGQTPTQTQVRNAINASGLSISDDIEISVNQNTNSVLHVTLPSPEQLASKISTIEAGNYVLNDVFCEFCNNGNPTKDEALDFYNFRLGDYVLQHCM